MELPDGVLLLEKRLFHDTRGYFSEIFGKNHQEVFDEIRFVQDNLSKSGRNVLRGLHWQIAPREQGKFVTCVQGEILDLVVDIRQSSSSFGRLFTIPLSEKDRRSIYVPPGFAHGFQSLLEDTIVMYKVTNFWSPDLERSLNLLDPNLKLQLPEKPILSEKDLAAPFLEQLSAMDLFE